MTKKDRFEIRLDPKEMLDLKYAAENKGVSRTEIIRRALKYYYSVMDYVD